MLWNVLAIILGVLLFLFIFWKRLKDDYASEIIFKTAFAILFGISGFWLLAQRLFPSWFFFGGFSGALIGLWFSVFKFRIRFYETLESFVIGIIPCLAIGFLMDSVVRSSLSSFLGFLGMLIFLLIFYLLDVHYKNFRWYKSGRIGFVGLSTMAIFFLTRSAIAMTGSVMLSFVSRYEALVSGSIAFILFLAIYNLGRKE